VTANRRDEERERVTLTAQALGVDLSTVTGTGPRGSVIPLDVLAASYRDADRRAGRTTSAARPAAPVDRRGPVGSVTSAGHAPVEPWLLAENAGTDAGPELRSLANRRGVRLRDVKGTGFGGAITPADVAAVADRQDAQQARAWQAANPAPITPVEPRVTFTASGLPVSVLAEVPAPVRPALAAAPTHAEAFALVERYPRNLSDQEAAERLASDRSVSVRYGGASPAGVRWPGDPR
jgi:pyruvate/2-oxoglutarate dehydrogenase complex dihydrolipoamide acyltransferase (E2) component